MKRSQLVRMTLPAALAALLFALVGSALAGPARGQEPDEALDQPARLAAAIAWLRSNYEQPSGGYVSFGAIGAPADVPGTVDALPALAAAGARVDGPMAFLQANGPVLAAYAGQNGGAAGKTLLALAAAGVDPRDFGGEDYVARLLALDAGDGAYATTTPFELALAILGLAAAREAVPDTAVDRLISLQATDSTVAGAWDDGFGTAGNVDATAVALMALVAAGRGPGDAAVAAGRDFLAAGQLADGWEYGPSFGANASSTALAVQALKALGEDFYSADSAWAVDGRSPLSQLAAWQADDGPFLADFGNGPMPDFFATIAALPALAGRAWPLPARRVAVQQAASCLGALQDPAGGWPSFAGGEPDAGGSARAIRALLAAGEPPPPPAVDALLDLAPAYLDGARGGRIGQLMLADAALDGALAELDLSVRLGAVISPTGELDDTSFGPFGHSLALLGQLAVGETPDPAAVAWLEGAHTGGDWGGPDANGVSLNVLAQLDRATPEMIAALAATQQADGGWGFALPSSPSSTAEAVQGLQRAGEDLYAPAWQRVISGTVNNPFTAVLAGQDSASGCWPNLFGPGDDPFSTVDAILLLAEPAPVAPATIAEPAPTAAPATPTAAPTEAPTAAAPTPTAPLAPTATPPVPETEAPATTAAPEPTATPAVDGDDGGLPRIVEAALAAAAGLGLAIYALRRRAAGGAS